MATAIVQDNTYYDLQPKPLTIMHHFMIFLKEDLEAASQLTEEQLQEDITQYTQWVEKLAEGGNFVAGEPLEGRGWQLKGDEVVTNGAFIEGNEAISGYFILKAENEQQAIRLAKTCPVFKSGGSLELRPIMKI